MSTEPALITNFPDFLAFLDREGVLHQAETSAKAISIPTSHNNVEGLQFIRWQAEDGILQFIQAMPIEVAAERLPLMESAIARLNHALAWPGLDLNHEFRTVAYRVVLPLQPRGGVEPREIQSCFRMAVRTAADLVPTLHRIASGEVDPAHVLADAQREFARSAEAAAAAAAAAPAATPAAAPAAAPAESAPAAAPAAAPPAAPAAGANGTPAAAPSSVFQID